MKFSGCYTALVTPFLEDDSVDFNSLEQLVEWNLQSGVDGFVVCGTTAETPTLSAKERVEIICRVSEIVAGRCPIVVGTGTNSTRSTVELTREAKELGASAALVVNPYYNKPTQEGLYQHFITVAREGGLPVILYNIPGRTSVDISFDTFSKLSKHSEFIGVKEASGSSSKLMDILDATDDKIPLIAGDDHAAYLVMTLGGAGVISASSNVIPAEMSAVPRLCKAGQWQEGLRTQVSVLEKIRALFMETNPAPVKAALKMIGRITTDRVRLPLSSVRETTRGEIERLFTQC